MSYDNERFPLWPIDSLAGQESIPLSEKGNGSFLPKRGFRCNQPGDSFPPGFLCGEKAGWAKEDCYRPFLSLAPAILPGKREKRYEQARKYYVVQA